MLLGRDYRPGQTSSANFLVNESRVSFITGDVDGIFRMFEYDPTSESFKTLRLLVSSTADILL